MPSEIEGLIADIGRGDRDAFWNLYRKVSPRLFGIVWRIHPVDSGAQRILQDVFIKIWHNAARFRPGRYSGETWLISIARNHALDCVRAAEALGEATDRAEISPDLALPTAGQSDVAKALENLPQDRSDALLSAYLYGEGYAALADRYHVSPLAMKARLQHGVMVLREALTQ